MGSEEVEGEKLFKDDSWTALALYSTITKERYINS